MLIGIHNGLNCFCAKKTKQKKKGVQTEKMGDSVYTVQKEVVSCVLLSIITADWGFIWRVMTRFTQLVLSMFGENRAMCIFFHYGRVNGGQ